MTMRMTGRYRRWSPKGVDEGCAGNWTFSEGGSAWPNFPKMLVMEKLV